jgi:stage V sporulation protein AB
LIKAILTILVGLAGGLAIGASITAFFVVLGVTARIIKWSKREEYLVFYQISLVLGALLSCLVYFFDFTIKYLDFFTVPLGLLMGIFVGTIISALTETLDIISVAANKLSITKLVYLIVVVILLGKIIGSLVFFLIPGFF